MFRQAATDGSALGDPTVLAGRIEIFDIAAAHMAGASLTRPQKATEPLRRNASKPGDYQRRLVTIVDVRPPAVSLFTSTRKCVH